MLPFPIYRQHVVSIENLSDTYEPLAPVDISSPYLDFFLRSSFEGQTLSIDWTLKTKQEAVSPSDHEDYRKTYDSIRSNTIWWYDLTGEGKAGTGKIGPKIGPWFDGWSEDQIAGAVILVALVATIICFWIAVRG